MALNGTATLTSGSTTVTVTHTYGVTPDSIEINWLGDLGAASWYFSSVTSTEFTITVSSAPMDDVSFMWAITTVVSSPTALTTAYCTAAQVKMFSQITYTQLEIASDADYSSFIDSYIIPEIQKAIDSYVGHSFLSNSGTLTLDGNGKNVLFIKPPYVPVLAVSSVTLDGTAITSSIKTYDTYLAYEGGIFTCDRNNRQNVQVVLTYGYSSVPADVQLTCALACSNLLADLVRRKLMPDNVAAALQSGSNAGVINGLAKATLLLHPEIRDMLDKYVYSTLDVT